MRKPVKVVESRRTLVDRYQVDAGVRLRRGRSAETDKAGDDGNAPDLEILEAELLARGRQEQRLLLRSAEMLSLQRAAAVTGISARTLGRMRADGRLLALVQPGTRRVIRYPAWQFEPGILNVLPDIIRAFGSDRMWQVYDFMACPEPLLGGHVPLDELRAGRWAAVRRILPTAAGFEQGAY